MPELENALNYSLDMIRRNMETLEYFPERCEGKQWTLVVKERPAAHWVDGHWVGLLWLAYAHTGDPKIEAAAREWAERAAWLQDCTGLHDLGFIFYLSNILGARLTGDESLLPAAVQAAHTMTRRYNAAGEYLQAWGNIDGAPAERGRTNIDLMMNLALLFWAGEHTGNLRTARVAARHARTSRLALMRPDGSTAHCADFDPETGAFLRQETHQGLAATSCWSRGQAWAQYGFADAFRRTADEAFRAASRRLAEYMLRRAPEDLVPYWDYDSPDIPQTFRDSSAASVLACGLLELAAGEEPEKAVRWRDSALAIVQSLWRNYSSRATQAPAILLHGTRSAPHRLADHGLIYGDYYFVEALTRLLRPDLAARAFPDPQ